MSLLDHERYEDRYEGRNKTVFRGQELVYTVNPEKPMRIIGDGDWYDEAALQMEVWSHNISQLQRADIPLSFEDFEKDAMFYEVQDDRIDGKLYSPALVINDFEYVEAYPSRSTFEDIPDNEEEQVKDLQEDLDKLIDDGFLAIQERETVKNDYRGPSCLRQFGRDENGKVYLLEFGELHNRLDGPFTGQEFLEEHNIERENHGVRTPIMLGDFSTDIAGEEYRKR